MFEKATFGSLLAGTIVRLAGGLAGEHGELVGYKSTAETGRTYVLVPGPRSLGGIEVSDDAEVEVLVTPGELAHACLTESVARMARRWKRRRGGDEGGEGGKVVELRPGSLGDPRRGSLAGRGDDLGGGGGAP